MDLNKMMNESLIKIESEGKIQEMIDTQIERTIQSAVENFFGSYSTFSKKLKKQLEEHIQINLECLDIPSYNELINQAIKEKLDDQIATEGVARLNETIGSLLSAAKTEYKLSELVEELAEEVDKEEIGYDDMYEMSMHIDDSFSLSTIIALDYQPDKSEYECKYRFWVDKKTGKISNISVQEKRSGRRREVHEFDARAIMRGLHGLEETLFKMYAKGSKVIIDEDHVDLEVSNPNFD